MPPEPKMLVQKFVINGANLFTAKEFEPVLNQYRDKDLTMTELKKAADELTALYRKNGYLTCMVYLPPQDITNNTVEFKVVEGKVGNIKIEEPKYTKVKNIENKFLIEKGQILNTQQLQANLHRINKPDRTMRAVLSPGADKDTTDILLKIEQEKPHNHFSVDINNRGTKDTGLLRWGLNYMNTSLLGNDDILTLKYEDNIRHHVYSASAAYEIPVSRYNTRLGAYVAYSKADINGQFAVLSPNGVGTFAGFYVSHPWLDKEIFDDTTNSTLSMRSNLTAGFDAISVRNKILGEVTSNDQLRVLKGGLNFEETDKYGRGGLTGEIQVGIPGFLGSMGRHDVKASRIDAGGEFQKYNLSFTRVTSLPASSMLINLFKGQYSPNCLATVEQMIFGGADSIRGYPEADYLADYGWMTTAELRTPFFLLPPELKVPFDKNRTSLTEAIQMLLFVDGGIGYLNGARSGELSSKQLVSVGFGFRANFYDHLRGRLDIGFPVGDDASDKSNGTVHFGIEYDW